MKPLLVSKPIVGLVLLLLTAQLACAASSISPSPTPPTLAAGAQSTQAPATQAAGTQALLPTSTGEHATPAEAQAMLNAAVEHYQTAGREQALKDFTDKKPPFENRDLYVVCLGSDHKITAFGGFPMLVGISADSIDITDGQPLGKLVWDTVGVAPQGSIPFHWKNPLSSQQESKTLFYQKLDQDVCGVAANTAQ